MWYEWRKHKTLTADSGNCGYQALLKVKSSLKNTANIIEDWHLLDVQPLDNIRNHNNLCLNLWLRQKKWKKKYYMYLNLIYTFPLLFSLHPHLICYLSLCSFLFPFTFFPLLKHILLFLYFSLYISLIHTLFNYLFLFLSLSFALILFLSISVHFLTLVRKREISF